MVAISSTKAEYQFMAMWDTKLLRLKFLLKDMSINVEVQIDSFKEYGYECWSTNENVLWE